jgi:hypothetical protein
VWFLLRHLAHHIHTWLWLVHEAPSLTDFSLMTVIMIAFLIKAHLPEVWLLLALIILRREVTHVCFARLLHLARLVQNY